MIPYFYFVNYHSAYNNQWTNDKLLVKDTNIYYTTYKHYQVQLILTVGETSTDTCLIELNNVNENYFVDKNEIKNYLENNYQIGSYIKGSYMKFYSRLQCDLTYKEIRLYNNYNSTPFILFISFFYTWGFNHPTYRVV